MIQVSIDLSTNDETAQNRIFGNVIDIQNDMLLCEYTRANFDFDNQKKISLLEKKLKIAENALIKITEVNTNRAIDSFAKCQMIAENALEKIRNDKNE